MIAKITELDGIVERLETLVRTIARERDSALEEVERLRKNLDDRELELLQLDEELQRATQRFDDERAATAQEREETERRLDDLASRIKSMLPPPSENSSEVAGELS
ncbi:MAG: hypothetical protein LBQ56_04975 [Synergistaceae bacterium]|jgi:predicted  nucleic acid-binding Zn-ribbon protein|nr:hypothetical protein [Synergistaceae bacterium]